MSEIYRVGIIGFAHMHIKSLAKAFGAHPQVEWVACADTVPLCPEIRTVRSTRGDNKRLIMEEYGITKDYEDYVKMLESESLDIALVCSENAQHPDVIEACAAAGVHVCVEKPMATDLGGALRMVRACEAADTELIVNWPTTWQPAAHKLKELIDAGTIGRVLEVRARFGSTGPLGTDVYAGAVPMTGPERGATWWHQDAAGGGAFLDYCCYGCMIAHWLIDQPAVAAMGLRANLNSHYGDTDDNAVVVVRFPEAMALIEATWSTLSHGVSGGPIVIGTAGTLIVDKKDGKTVVRLERSRNPEEAEFFEGDPLPEGRSDVAQEFIHHLETGDPVHPTLEMYFNLDAMAIQDAGWRSAQSGKLETVDGRSWRIG